MIAKTAMSKRSLVLIQFCTDSKQQNFSHILVLASKIATILKLSSALCIITIFCLQITIIVLNVFR